MGGTHIESASLIVRRCDRPEKTGVEMGFDQLFEWRSTGKCLTPEQDPEYVQSLENVTSLCRGIDVLELRIIVGSQKGEGGNKRACTDAGDDLKIRSGTRIAPAVEDARTEGTTRAAT